MMERTFRLVSGNWKVELYELYLTNYGKLLHPNNFCLLKVKIKLAKFYGRLPAGNMMGQTLSLIEYVRISLDRKHKLCDESLKVLDKLQPGLSNLKGKNPQTNQEILL